MALEFAVAVKVLDEYIELLKQELIFAMAEQKPEKRQINQEIIAIKRELDKAVQERMKLIQIYHCPDNNRPTVSSTAASA
jgi:hypothetical protein